MSGFIELDVGAGQSLAGCFLSATEAEVGFIFVSVFWPIVQSIQRIRLSLDTS